MKTVRRSVMQDRLIKEHGERGHYENYDKMYDYLDRKKVNNEAIERFKKCIGQK